MNTAGLMQQALLWAEKGRLLASPNPVVGCVIVNAQEKLIGVGYHRGCGSAHAEVVALNDCSESPKGATVFVTLEPCAHHGYTPPCVDALIRAKVAKVYVACLDPNPLVNGKGIACLRQAGIAVEVGLCAQEAKRQNISFFHFITEKKPWVIAKWAMSLDGKLSAHSQDSPKLSGEDTWEHVHQLRSSVDAVLIGAHTLRRDDPQLTCRSQKISPKDHRNPLRVVITRSGNLPSTAKFFNPEEGAFVFTQKPLQQALNAHTVLLGEDNFLPELLKYLWEHKVSRLLVEGGEITLESFFKKNLVNEVYAYLTPHWIGDGPQKRTLLYPRAEVFQQDALITGVFAPCTTESSGTKGP